MSLSDLANFGEFLSNILVLACLVYVALQMRQAEKNQRADLNQGYFSLVISTARWFGELERATFYERAARGAIDLDQKN